MQVVETKHFGKLEYDPAEALTFPSGLPGYPEDKRFLLLDMEETNNTFFWLQSLDDGDVCFPMMDVYKAIPDYDPCVDPEELNDLGPIKGATLEIYNITVIPEEVAQTRVNLRAPVIINRAAHIGKQVICANEDYSIRYYVMEDLKRINTQEVA
ncbi:MAG: flagellar assembly protein FliW [Defluviitaleaceae bacterium]|nr:flagellar assembly protein FliW [Defluviitaleaceae bacterium]